MAFFAPKPIASVSAMRILLIFLLAILPGAVLAENDAIVAFDKPGSVAIALRLEGYQARMKDDDGTPLIESGVGGTSFAIRFFGCTDNKDCDAAMFVASFDTRSGVDLDTINDWNAVEVFGRAYLDDECDAYFEHLIVSDPKVDHAVFVRMLDHWDHYLHEFRRHIRFDAEDRADLAVATCGGASETL